MGTQGEFKEYAYTGSLVGDGHNNKVFMYSPLYNLTNTPPPSGVIIKSGSTHLGPFQQLYFVTASQVVALSGSLQGDLTSSVWPTGATLFGMFTAVRINTGIVLASYGKSIYP